MRVEIDEPWQKGHISQINDLGSAWDAAPNSRDTIALNDDNWIGDDLTGQLVADQLLP